MIRFGILNFASQFRLLLLSILRLLRTSWFASDSEKVANFELGLPPSLPPFRLPLCITSRTPRIMTELTFGEPKAYGYFNTNGLHLQLSACLNLVNNFQLKSVFYNRSSNTRIVTHLGDLALSGPYQYRKGRNLLYRSTSTSKSPNANPCLEVKEDSCFSLNVICLTSPSSRDCFSPLPPRCRHEIQFPKDQLWSANYSNPQIFSNLN